MFLFLNVHVLYMYIIFELWIHLLYVYDILNSVVTNLFTCTHVHAVTVDSLFVCFLCLIMYCTLIGLVDA